METFPHPKCCHVVSWAGVEDGPFRVSQPRAQTGLPGGQGALTRTYCVLFRKSCWSDCHAQIKCEQGRREGGGGRRLLPVLGKVW